jgi:hypothetical protein
MGEMRNAYTILIGESEGKRPLGRHRHRLEDNIQMDLKEISWVWIGFIWLRIGTGDRFL